MSTWTRAAIALGALALMGAGLSTFLPSSPAGATCGTWVAPDWEESTVTRAEELAADARAAGEDDIARQADEVGRTATLARATCSNALATRRTVALVLMALAVAVPAAVVWVGRSARRRGAG